MAGEKRRAIGRWAVWALVFLVVAYPLSYAPAVRWKVKEYELEYDRLTGLGYSIDGTTLPAYKPVDWLIDHSPLDKPLFAWARLWGVEGEFQQTVNNRALDAALRRILSAPPAP